MSVGDIIIPGIDNRELPTAEEREDWHRQPWTFDGLIEEKAPFEREFHKRLVREATRPLLVEMA